MAGDNNGFCGRPRPVFCPGIESEKLLLVLLRHYLHTMCDEIRKKRTRNSTSCSCGRTRGSSSGWLKNTSEGQASTVEGRPTTILKELLSVIMSIINEHDSYLLWGSKSSSLFSSPEESSRYLSIHIASSDEAGVVAWRLYQYQQHSLIMTMLTAN